MKNHSRDIEYLGQRRRLPPMTHETPDKRSFILGMITAFCECVAGGCKWLALSPPLSRADFDAVVDEAYEIIEKHGLLHEHEESLDQPESARFDWILIAAKQGTIDAYLALRKEGYSPVASLAPFAELLSYNPAESVHTGYDAYREFFLKNEISPDGEWKCL